MIKIHCFTLHDDREQSVLMRDLRKWKNPLKPSSDIFGPVIRYSWLVDGAEYQQVDLQNLLSLRELPDASGFICFESDSTSDNCLLLDVYGKERMRLTVPWQFTRPQNPESAKPPTSFARINAPCINPADGKEGQFGVNAWVEHAGAYYFELDNHTGQFLWEKEIRD